MVVAFSAPRRNHSQSLGKHMTGMQEGSHRLLKR